MPRPWRTLVLLYSAIDAEWIDGGQRRRARREMSEEEYGANRRVIEGVPDAVSSWSEGNAALEPFDIRDAGGAVKHLTDVGGGHFWVAPLDCRREIQRFAPRRRYDSILALWPSDGEIRLCGWGCTNGPSDEANGAGFSSMISNDWRRYPVLPYPEEGFVHEWLHQVEATFRSRGVGEVVFPSLHDAGDSRSCRSQDEPPHGATYGQYHERTETWQPWYLDYMTGRVRRPAADGCFGLTREVWELRGR